jgi:hypothetical protein
MCLLTSHGYLIRYSYRCTRLMTHSQARSEDLTTHPAITKCRCRNLTKPPSSAMLRDRMQMQKDPRVLPTTTLAWSMASCCCCCMRIMEYNPRYGCAVSQSGSCWSLRGRLVMAGFSIVETGGLAAKETATWNASREAERSAAKSTLLAGISCLDLPPWHVRRSSEKGGIIAFLLLKGWRVEAGRCMYAVLILGDD